MTGNNGNLIPMTERTEEERRDFSRKGGINSGKTRRKKRDIYQITKMMMDSSVDGAKAEYIRNVAKDFYEMEDELTINAVLVAGQIQAATNGNVEAFKNLIELGNKSVEIDENKSYHMPITDITKDFVDVYREIHAAFDTGKWREFISKGGRGSIKSNFWAAIGKETIMNDKLAHVVYTRRYKTDLRGSVYNQFLKTVTRDGELDDWDFTTSPMMAKYKKTGQCVIFVGCDKPISLKSYNLSFGYVKMVVNEEADEMAGINQIDNVEDTFLRADVNSISVKVFNPPKSANNWMNKYTADAPKREKCYVSHSYYYNVPVEWLGHRFFDRATWFKEHKPKYYANNYLGEVVGTGGTIFENLEQRQITDEEINSFGTFCYGLDFGYEHPQTFIQCHYDYETDTLYPVFEVYSKRCKNSTFARKINNFKNCEIICDSARPDSIAEMIDWGFNAYGARKRWSNKGRAYCWEWLQQTTKIVVDPERTPHLCQELTQLEFEQLRDGEFSSEYPTLGEDCIMALIYGLNRVIMQSRREDLYEDETIDEAIDEPSDGNYEDL